MFMTTPTSVAFGDLDLDGHPDLVVTTADDSKVNVFQGAVGGKFPQQPASFATGASPQQVALADMNGDGRLDVVTANRDSNNVSLLLASCK